MIAILKKGAILGCVFSRIVLIIVAAALAATAAGCGGEARDAGGEVVASFYPLAWAVSELAPDRSVRNLTPAGAEPHDLELTPSQARAIAEADLVVYLGGGFQPAVERALESRSGSTFDAIQREPPAAGDPHVWLDPVAFALIVDRLGGALGARAEAKHLTARLQMLDREFRAGLRRCKRRVLVTSHAAFGHLARRYGLRQVALTGLAPEAEPGPSALAALVDTVRSTGTTIVFFETLVSPALARTVAAEAGAGTAVLDPLEGLSEARLSAGANYLTVMRENLAALRAALDCQ